MDPLLILYFLDFIVIAVLLRAVDRQKIIKCKRKN